MTGSPQHFGDACLRPSEALGRLTPSVTDTPCPETPTTEFGTQVRYGFRVLALGLLIPERVIGQVLDRPRVFPIPNTPSWLRGLCNLRGDLVPVFDLRELLGTEAAGNDGRWVLVLGVGEEAAAFDIDSLPVRIDSTHHPSGRPPVPAALGDHVHTTLLAGDDLWLDVDWQGFLRSLGPRIAAG